MLSLVLAIKKQFKTRVNIRKRLELVYYQEYFETLPSRTKWFSDDKEYRPKLDDAVMVLSESNFKNKHRFRLGIITGIKNSRDKNTSLDTVRVKIVEGSATKKTQPKPHKCLICGDKSLCNLSTSSRNCCLLEKSNSRQMCELIASEFVDGPSLNYFATNIGY